MTIRYPVIAGPTAGGKTELALRVAEVLRDEHGAAAEIISADSMQVYRGLDIGAAKPPMEERRGVPHHLIDVADPSEPFSVDRWLELADRAMREITERGGAPIVAGGTHLYITAYLFGMLEAPPPDEALRERLRGMEPGARRAELERVDPEAAARIHPNDARRTVRALEVFVQTGRPISELQTQWGAGRGGLGGEGAGGRPGAFLVGLDWETGALNQRINARVRGMMAAGLVEEVADLVRGGRFGGQAREGLGYKQLAGLLESGGMLEEERLREVVEAIKIETRRFAKNQRTWLRRLRAILASAGGSVWIPMPATGVEEAARIVVDEMCRGAGKAG